MRDTGGESIRRWVIDNVDFWHRETSGNGEILDDVVKASIVFFGNFFGAGHCDGERTGNKILNKGVDRRDD